MAAALDIVADAIETLLSHEAEVLRQLRAAAALSKLDRFFAILRDVSVDSADVVHLLFDELDGYADVPYGKVFFNGLKSQVEVPAPPVINILVAGNIGFATLNTYKASPFLSRAKRLVVRPFDLGQVRELARAFVPSLPEEVIEAIWVGSGGIPRIASYLLHHLWERQRKDGTPSHNDVMDVLSKLRLEERDYVRSIRGPIFDGPGAELARGIWRVVRQSGGIVQRSIERRFERCPCGARLEGDFGRRLGDRARRHHGIMARRGECNYRGQDSEAHRVEDPPLVPHRHRSTNERQ